MFSLRANEFIGQLSNDMSLISYLSTCFFQSSSIPLLVSSKWRKCKGNNNHIPNQKVKAEKNLAHLFLILLRQHNINIYNAWEKGVRENDPLCAIYDKIRYS